jgi:hypothetical protein
VKESSAVFLIETSGSNSQHDEEKLNLFLGKYGTFTGHVKVII